MIRKISDIIKEKKPTISFELFPPKTDKGRARLPETAATLNELDPDWFAVTYGAGGSTRELTTDIVTELQQKLDVPIMHHLTCVGHSQAELQAILKQLKENNIRNILALHGDPPQNEEGWQPAPDALDYCYQLIDLIRDGYDDFFSIGLAGFPEGHIECPDKETDTRYLKMKIDHGGQFVITQLFFDNQDYFDYLARAQRIGVTVPIIPGIIPITDYQALLRFSGNCGAIVPQRIHDVFKPLADDAEATYEAGIDFVVDQCRGLLAGGAPGLHFFALNKVEPTREILKRLRP